jgi:hypothetical protein
MLLLDYGKSFIQEEAPRPGTRSIKSSGKWAYQQQFLCRQILFAWIILI